MTAGPGSRHGRLEPAEVWRVVHAERRRLVADLGALSDAQWSTPSLCPGWTVHDVLAHLVDTARTTRWSFVRDMIRARGSFDRANDQGVARERRDDPRQTLEALLDAGDLTRTPPAPLATRLVEAVVHGEDIRRPVGLTGTYPRDAVLAALHLQLRTSVGMGGGKDRAAGLRLSDTTTGQAWGAGDEVAGEALDLLLAVSGRPVPGDRLRGPGAARFVTAAPL